MADAQAGTEPTEAELWAQESARRASGTPDNPTPATPPAEELEAGAAEDDGVSPELKEILGKIGNIQDVVGQLTQRVSSADGRVAAMQREIQASKTVAQYVPNAPNQQAIKAASKSLDKWNQLREEFPDWSSAIEEYVTSAAPVAPDMSRFQNDVANAISELKNQVTMGLEEAKVVGAYRDWRKEVNTPRFEGWWKQQPAEFQQLASSPRGEDTIQVLDKYFTDVRNSTRDVKQERQTKLQAAATTRRPAAPAPVSDENMTPDQIWQQESRRRIETRSQRGR